MLKINHSLKNGGGNLLKKVVAYILADGTRLFHCGEIKLRGFRNGLGLLAGRLAKRNPPLDELRSCQNPQFGMTINHSKCRHLELVLGSFTERLGEFPSPREEGVEERVLPFAKVEILKRIIKKSAFTLAEVLITLGIIGVVAAITIPSLVTNYQKHVVETKLAKFNSTMNQAVRLSMVDNGDPDGWVEQSREYTYSDMVNFMNTYFLPYMKYVKMKRNSANYNNGVSVILLDGSMFTFSIDLNGGDIVYYVNGKAETNPRNKFQYQFTKRVHWSYADKMNSASYIEPYILNWNGTVNHLKTGAIWACKKGCTNCGYCTS